MCVPMVAEPGTAVCWTTPFVPVDTGEAVCMRIILGRERLVPPGDGNGGSCPLPTMLMAGGKWRLL